MLGILESRDGALEEGNVHVSPGDVVATAENLEDRSRLQLCDLLKALGTIGVVLEGDIDVARKEEYRKAHLEGKLVELVVKGRNDEAPEDPESPEAADEGHEDVPVGKPDTGDDDMLAPSATCSRRSASVEGSPKCPALESKHTGMTKSSFLISDIAPHSEYVREDRVEERGDVMLEIGVTAHE
jgi:hypothetical protein